MLLSNSLMCLTKKNIRNTLKSSNSVSQFMVFVLYSHCIPTSSVAHPRPPPIERVSVILKITLDFMTGFLLVVTEPGRYCWASSCPLIPQKKTRKNTGSDFLPSCCQRDLPIAAVAAVLSERQRDNVFSLYFWLWQEFLATLCISTGQRAVMDNVAPPFNMMDRGFFQSPSKFCPPFQRFPFFSLLGGCLR